jgi:hypothetical protein
MSPIFGDELLAKLDITKPRPKGQLPPLPRPDDLRQLEAWHTLAFRPPTGWQFETFERTSQRKVDPCSITFRNGQERRRFYFDRQADLMTGNLRGNVVSVGGGWLRMPHLSPGEIEDVWVGLCYAGRVLAEHDDRDETRKWMEELLDASSALRGHTLELDGRYEAIRAIRANGEFHQRDAKSMINGSEQFQRRPLRFVDEQTDEQWVRSGEAYTFIYWVGGAQKLDRSGLKARLATIGVEWRRWSARKPNSTRQRATLYRLSPDLVEYIDDAQPAIPDFPQRELGGVNQRGERMPI